MTGVDEGRAAALAAGVLTTAVVVFSAWLLFVWAPGLDTDPSDAAPLTPTSNASAGSTNQVTTESSATNSPASPVLAVLGDSFTAARARASLGKTWPGVLCAELGCEYHEFSEPGSGYLAEGRDGDSFIDEVSSLLAVHPDVVVLAGGAFDKDLDPSSIEDAVHTVVSEVVDGLPDAQVVVLSPFWRDTDVPSEVEDIGSQLEQAADDAALPYVDVSQIFGSDASDDQLISSAGRPSNRGEREIAAALRPTIAAALNAVGN